MSYDDSVSVYSCEKPNFNNTDIPVEIITQSEVEVNKTDAELNKSTLDKKLLTQSILYEVFEKPESRIVSRKINTKMNGNDYIAEVSYIFNENIAQTFEFSVTD